MSNERFASVCDAIADTPQEAENMKLRSALMMEIARRIGQGGLTQVQAARLFGVTQPRISDLVRGKINLFALDALVNMATAAGFQVKMRADKSNASGSRSLSFTINKIVNKDLCTRALR